MQAQQSRYRRGDWTLGPAGGGARSWEEDGANCMGRRRRRVDRADAGGALPEAIAALSRTLPAGPSPEIFRRAKFDLPEAVRPARQATRPSGAPDGRREAAGPADRHPLIPAGPRTLAAAFLLALAAADKRRLSLACPG